MANRTWILEDLDLGKLRDLVISYGERDSETAVLALNRILVVVEAEAKENKDWLRFMHLSASENPSPTFSGEEEKVALISHVLDFLVVIEADFELLKKDLVIEDPKTASEGLINSRWFVDKHRSRMLKKVDALVLKELRVQKAGDLDVLLWKVKTRTLDHMMMGIVVNQLVSLEKLKRIEKCLCDVISDARVFILTCRFIPQPEFFPLVQVSPSLEREQHVSNAQELIDLSVEFLDLIGECEIDKLRNDELDEAWDVVMKMLGDLEKTAFAEGGVYALEE